MDQIALPRIEADASLYDAFLLMHERNCSGVFVEHPKGPRVIDFPSLWRAYEKRGNVKIGSVRPRLLTITLREKLFAKGIHGGAAVLETAARRMDDGAASYAIVSVAQQMAKLMTRYEAFGYLGSPLPSLWRCGRKPIPHIRMSNAGGTCDKDGTPLVAL
jgi:hypothetical protein